MKNRALLPLLCGLAGCVEHLPASLPPAEVGLTDSVPVGPASGRARSVHFFGWRRFGDDTTEAAVRDAKTGNEDLELINVLVERHVHCFPACDAPLISWSETDVTGTLARYKRMPEWQKPAAPEPKRHDVGKVPDADDLVERLMNMYKENPQAAADFFASLDRETRRQVVEQVLSRKGITTAQGWTFRIPKDDSPDEKRFLAWFVAAYTTYQPLDE